MTEVERLRNTVKRLMAPFKDNRTCDGLAWDLHSCHCIWCGAVYDGLEPIEHKYGCDFVPLMEELS